MLLTWILTICSGNRTDCGHEGKMTRLKVERVAVGIGSVRVFLGFSALFYQEIEGILVSQEILNLYRGAQGIFRAGAESLHLQLKRIKVSSE